MSAFNGFAECALGQFPAHCLSYRQQKNGLRKLSDRFIVLALPIFPGRRQPSIVGAGELNYRVRNGNGWTLALISTYFTFSEKKVSKEKFLRLFSPYRLPNSKYYIRYF